MSRNEKWTENFVRKRLASVGITDEGGFVVDEQKSDNPRVEKLLKSASKSGNSVGKPEFLISHKKANKDFLIVIECKALTKNHVSETRDQYKDFAVDGVLLYASHLAKEFNVIAVAVSGQSEQEIKIDTFLNPKGVGSATVLTDEKKVPVKQVVSWEDYIRYATYDENLAQARKSGLNKFSRDLHDYMRDYAKITEAQKPLLVSGVLIALMEEGFRRAYSTYEKQDLAKKTFEVIRDKIKKAQLGANQEEKKKAVINAFSFIEHHPELQKFDKKRNESPLAHIVRDIDEKVRPFTQDPNHYDYDVIGNFYGEFIRYTGGDGKGLGIVLTPKHITDMFADLAKLNKNSVVLDTCCGTGGFLISAMKKMTEGLDEREQVKILENSLFGVEQEPNMFALAVSNMILRGDGKTNLYQGDCFDEEIFKQVKGKATAGFINPPFSQRGDDRHEWNYVITLLDALQKNATGIVIVPMQLAIDQNQLRERLLKEHRLEAVMSMPNDLFYPIGIVSCVMVFTAHVPHDSDKHHETWFGSWKDDGFRKDRNEGRIPTSRWLEIREKWIEMFRRKEIAGKSVWKRVVVNDEWCAEAYLETDYSVLDDKDFKQVVLTYIAYKVRGGSLSFVKEFLGKSAKQKLIFSDRTWTWFRYEDLFDVKIGKSVDLKKLGQSEDGINYVGRTEENNAITAKVLNDGSFIVYEGNCITVPMVGNELKSSYQTEPFCVSQNIAILYPKGFALNLYNAQFLNTIIRRDAFRFAYGRTLSLDRLRMLKIKLPVSKKGDPDWQFMDDYIKSLLHSSAI